MNKRAYQICSNCVMDTTDPQISFDENGLCDFCKNYYETILPSWHTGERGWEELMLIAENIKKQTKGKKYNCIIGLSGGIDSSFLTHIAKEKLGLNPLLLVVDTGWNLNVANDNVARLVEKLNLDIETITINWEEMRDVQLAFFKSAVPYQDLPQDAVIFSTLYNYAAKHGFKYILTGGNFSTECVKPPQEWTYYNDVRFIKDIHKKYGTIPLKNFPLCNMFKYRIFYRYFKGIRVLKPLNYVEYEKEKAVSILEKEYAWTAYENKHFEDRFTRFYEGWWLPQKFGYDKRRCYNSSLILTGQMTRKEAIENLESHQYSEEVMHKDKRYICDRLGITENEMDKFFVLPNKTFRDYKNSYGIIKKAIKVAMILGVEKRNFR